MSENLTKQTQIIKEFLESRGIEADQETINEFLSSLARFVGSGAKRISGAADKFVAKRAHADGIKKLNKQTMTAKKGLQGLASKKGSGMKGGNPLHSPEALKHIRDMRSASFERLRAKGYNVGGGSAPKGLQNKGRFVGKANFQAKKPGFASKIKRQIESIIKNGDQIFEGSLGDRRRRRVDKLRSKQFKKSMDAYDKANSTPLSAPNRLELSQKAVDASKKHTKIAQQGFKMLDARQHRRERNYRARLDKKFRGK